MAQTTIRISDDLHNELSDAAHNKRKKDKNWSMNKEIVLRLESHGPMEKRIAALLRKYGA